MKTLLATIDYWPAYGGVANYYGNLVLRWPEQGGLSVLDNSKKDLVDEGRSFVKWWPAVKTIRRLLKANSFDHLIVGQVLPLGTVVYYLQKFYRFEYSVVLHGMDFAYAIKQSSKKELTRKILMKAKRIICANTYVSKLVIEFLGKEHESKIFVVSPGIEPNTYQIPDDEKITALKKQYDLEGKFVLLSLGRLVKRKGVDQTILALARLSDRWPKLAFIVAGAGPDELYLKSYADSLNTNFSKVIKFVGPVNDEEKWQFLHLSNALIMPAREEAGDFEGFGIVYVEAGMASKPVIAGASGGVGDAVVNEVNGILVNPIKSDEIASAIELLIDNPQVGENLGQAGRERALQMFQWEKLADKFYEIINS